MASEIDKLRAEVMRRQQAANAKVSRMRRQKSIDVAGTEFDVRRDPNKIKRYNGAQLRAHLERLNEFTSRKTQFVAGNRGVPIPASAWRAYKRDEALFNSKVSREYTRVKNYQNPDVNMTVEDYDKNIRADKIEAAGAASHRPMSAKEVKASRVTGLAALKELHMDIKRRRNRKYLPKQIAKQRETANKMLNQIGNPEYLKRISELSDHQFDVVFNWMGFAEDVSMRYLQATQGGRNSRDDFAEQVEESQAIDYWLNVAQTQIPKAAPKDGSFSVWKPGSKAKARGK